MLATLVVDDDFLKTMNIDIVDGRWFLRGDKGKTCIMSEEAVKQFNWAKIEGKHFNNGREGGFEVVGVVNNFHIESFHQRVKPVCIISVSSFEDNSLCDYSIRITKGDVESKLNQLKQVWNKISPNDPMEFAFYDIMFDAMYRKEKLLATIITFFSVIAIVLSCLGVLGQVFQTCLNRTKEIGIRKVNGAGVWTIIGMLNYDFFKLVLIAFLVASPISYYVMSRWLQNFAYKTEMSWWIFALAGMVVLVISFITVTWQSWRAATRNPVESLRFE